MDDDVMASATFELLGLGGRREVRVEVSRPRPESEDEWSCAVSLRGLHDDVAAMRGGDSLQALSLGLELARRLLQGAIQDGVRLVYPGSDEEVPLEAYFPG